MGGRDPAQSSDISRAATEMKLFQMWVQGIEPGPTGEARGGPALLDQWFSNLLDLAALS